MKKEDTIKMYIDAYLEGKQEDARAKFMLKDIDRQYSAIMAWRYRRSRRNDGEDNAGAGAAILEFLINARKKLAATVDLTDQELRDIDLEMSAFSKTMDKFLQQRTQRQIADLERRRQEIEEKLRLLKSIRISD